MISFVLYTDGEGRDRREWKNILKNNYKILVIKIYNNEI